MIGQGSFGVVFLAAYREARVAVKMLSLNAEQQAAASSSWGSTSSAMTKIQSKTGSGSRSVSVRSEVASHRVQYNTMQREAQENMRAELAARQGDAGADSTDGSLAQGQLVRPDSQAASRFGLSRVFSGPLGGARSKASKKARRDAQRALQQAVDDFMAEISCMTALRHPNIVMFMGACVRQPDLAIITEFMERGSLLDLFDDPLFTFDWDRRIGMALDVSRGMAYLHSASPPILHLDLKSPNLLVDER